MNNLPQPLNQISAKVGAAQHRKQACVEREVTPESQIPARSGPRLGIPGAASVAAGTRDVARVFARTLTYRESL